MKDTDLGENAFYMDDLRAALYRGKGLRLIEEEQSFLKTGPVVLTLGEEAAELVLSSGGQGGKAVVVAKDEGLKIVDHVEAHSELAGSDQWAYDITIISPEATVREGGKCFLLFVHGPAGLFLKVLRGELPDQGAMGRNG